MAGVDQVTLQAGRTGTSQIWTSGTHSKARLREYECLPQATRTDRMGSWEGPGSKESKWAGCVASVTISEPVEVTEPIPMRFYGYLKTFSDSKPLPKHLLSILPIL